MTVEGNPAAPVSPLAVGALRTGHMFLADIAHSANPFSSQTGAPLAADADAGIGDDEDPGTYDDELLAEHFMAGDGRVNENIGLTAVHHVFHAEHNRLVDHTKDVVLGDAAQMPRALRLSGRSRFSMHGSPSTFPPRRRGNRRTAMGRRAPVPGGEVRHRDAVSAPGVRGVRAQDSAPGRCLPGAGRVRYHHQCGDRRRVRAYRLSLRPFDAAGPDRPARSRLRVERDRPDRRPSSTRWRSTQNDT